MYTKWDHASWLCGSGGCELFGGLLIGDASLLAHGRDDGDKEILALIKLGLQLLAELALRGLDVVLGGALSSHEGEEALIDVNE